MFLGHGNLERLPGYCRSSELARSVASHSYFHRERRNKKIQGCAYLVRFCRMNSFEMLFGSLVWQGWYVKRFSVRSSSNEENAKFWHFTNIEPTNQGIWTSRTPAATYNTEVMVRGEGSVAWYGHRNTQRDDRHGYCRHSFYFLMCGNWLEKPSLHFKRGTCSHSRSIVSGFLICVRERFPGLHGALASA